MAGILHLFIDSNVLLECKVLEELQWEELGNYDEFHLIVCRTVQREIDNHKSDSRNRVQDRARKASSLFGKILESTEGYHPVRTKRPIVKLFLEMLSKPNQTHTSHISQEKPDDEIVAFCYAYAKEHPSSTVKLLTDDTGPKITAKAVGLPYVPVADHWRLPPQDDGVARENARLQRELKKYEQSEPQFKMWWHDTRGNALTKFIGEYTVYQPLTDEDVHGLVQTLKQRFPMVSDFGEQRTTRLPSSTVLSSMYNYVPPSDEEIQNYRDKQYPSWIEECEGVFSRLRQTLQQRETPPRLYLTCQNEGNRPAEQALLNIQAMGHIHVFPVDSNRQHHDEEDEDTEITLPQPPRPPRGQRILHSSFSAFKFPNFSFPDVSMPLYRRTPILPDVSILYESYNGSDFVYTSGRPSKPVAHISLECKLWRHAAGHQQFCLEVFPVQRSGLVKGALECEIHATNLTRPARKRIPVSITVHSADTKPYADELIRNLSQ